VIARPLIQVFRDWMKSVRRYGLLYVAAYPFDLIRVHLNERAEGFDARFGTDTATIVYPWNLPSIEHESTPEIHAYEAVPVWLIREIFDSIPVQPNMFAFVDMGSGKGRALLVASEFPFVKIVGVELSHELHRIAATNIRRYRSESQQCTAFSLYCMNATDYTFGPEPLMLFLSNPFGRDTIQRIFANLETSLCAMPREAYLIYVNPRFEALARRAHFLRMVRKGGTRWRPWSRYVVYAAETQGVGIRNTHEHAFRSASMEGCILKEKRLSIANL
jgi:hypothetical protein